MSGALVEGDSPLVCEVDVGRAVAVEVVFALGGDVDAQQRLREGLALFPADEVVVTVPLLKQLDGAFAADFEQYAFVRTRHVGIACLRGRKVRVGVGVGLGHVQIGHAHAVAQLLDRQVDVVLRQRAQLGLGFGVVEVDFGRADDRQVGVGEVVTVGTEVGGSDELDGLVARHAGRKARHFDLGGVDAPPCNPACGSTAPDADRGSGHSSRNSIVCQPALSVKRVPSAIR